MEEWEKRCNDYSGETVHDLANEVLLLRTAGDALVEALDIGTWAADILPALAAWQEARRGCE